MRRALQRLCSSPQRSQSHFCRTVEIILEANIGLGEVYDCLQWGDERLKTAWLTPCEGLIYARKRPRPFAHGTKLLQGEPVYGMVWPLGPTRTREKSY